MFAVTLVLLWGLLSATAFINKEGHNFWFPFGMGLFGLNFVLPAIFFKTIYGGPFRCSPPTKDSSETLVPYIIIAVLGTIILGDSVWELIKIIRH